MGFHGFWAAAYLALRSITPSNLFVKACDSSVSDGQMAAYGNENTGSVALVQRSGDLWAIENLHATELIAGRSYGICIDMDGPVSTLSFGDTGLLVYITGLQAPGAHPTHDRDVFIHIPGPSVGKKICPGHFLGGITMITPSADKKRPHIQENALAGNLRPLIVPPSCFMAQRQQVPAPISHLGPEKSTHTGPWKPCKLKLGRSPSTLPSPLERVARAHKNLQV